MSIKRCALILYARRVVSVYMGDVYTHPPTRMTSHPQTRPKIEAIPPEMHREIGRFLPISHASMLYCSCRQNKGVFPNVVDFVERETLTGRNSAEMTPLHKAAARGASEEHIKKLINKNPEALGMVDVEGETPLHCALNTHPLRQVARFISLFLNDVGGIGKRALLVRSTWKCGEKTPLDIALDSVDMVSVDVLKLLILPQLLMHTGRYAEEIPLNLLMENTHPIRTEIIDVFVSAYPDVLQMLDGENRSPLQIAVTRHGRSEDKPSNLRTIAHIISIYPGALDIRDDDGITALGEAVYIGDFDLVKLVGTPASVQSRGRDLCDVIVTCCIAQNRSWQIVECIVNLTTAENLILHDHASDREDKTPLHEFVEACVYGASLEFLAQAPYIIGVFADRNAATLTEVDALGRTPLHTAVTCSEKYIDIHCGQHSVARIVRSLVDRMKTLNKDALLMQNSQGDTALHAAVSTEAWRRNFAALHTPPRDDLYQYDVISYLADTAPAALTIQNADGLTPLALAQSLDSQGVVNLLQGY